MQSTIFVFILYFLRPSLTSEIETKEDESDPMCEGDTDLETICDLMVTVSEETNPNATSPLCEMTDNEDGSTVTLNCQLSANTSNITSLDSLEQLVAETIPEPLTGESTTSEAEELDSKKNKINTIVKRSASGDNGVDNNYDNTEEGTDLNKNTQNENENPLGMNSTETNSTDFGKNQFNEKQEDESVAVESDTNPESSDFSVLTVTEPLEVEANFTNENPENSNEQIDPTNVGEEEATTVQETMEAENISSVVQETATEATPITNIEDPWFWSWFFPNGLRMGKSQIHTRSIEKLQTSQDSIDSLKLINLGKKDTEETDNPVFKLNLAFINQLDNPINSEPTLSEEEHFALEANQTKTECAGQCGVDGMSSPTLIQNIIILLEQEISESDPGETTTPAIWNTDQFVDQTNDLRKRSVDETNTQTEMDPSTEMNDVKQTEMDSNNTELEINILEIIPLLSITNMTTSDLDLSIPEETKNLTQEFFYFLLKHRNQNRPLRDLKYITAGENEISNAEDELVNRSQEDNTTTWNQDVPSYEQETTEDEENSTTPWYDILSLGEFNMLDIHNQTFSNEVIPQLA